MPDQQNGNPAPAAPPVQTSVTYVRDLEHEHGGNHRAALRKAGKDNTKLRRRLAAVSQELEGYKTRNPQGSIVLVGDDVTLWNELKPVVTEAKARNIKIGDIPKVFKERDDLAAKITAADTKSAARKAGEALGLKGDSLEAFEDLIDVKKVTLEEVETSVVKGNKVVKEKKWHAKLSSDDKGSPVLLEDFQPLKSYLKVLRAAPTEEGDGDSTDDSVDDQDDGDSKVSTVIPGQRSSSNTDRGASKKKDLAGGFMKSQYPTPAEMAKGNKDKE